MQIPVSMAAVTLALCMCLYVSIVRGSQTSAASVETAQANLSILLVGPPLTGHLIPLLRLGKELVLHGHNVSLCTTEVAGLKSPRSIAEKHDVSFISAGSDGLTKEELDGWTAAARRVSTLHSVIITLSALSKSHGVIVTFLDGPEYRQWDITVFDFMLEFGGIALSKKWDVPIVFTLGTCVFNPFLLPEWPFPILSSGYHENMTFTERLINTAVVYPLIQLAKVLLTIQVKHAVNVSPSPGLWTAMKHGMGVTSPVLVSTAFGMEFARTQTPLTHYVGPLLKPEVIKEEELPSYISHWLDDQPNRKVAYVSMGSFIHLTQSIVQAIVDGISEANYSAVWSLGASTRQIVEEQVKDKQALLVDWAPQLTLLSHPQVQLAILHCGFGGVQEAVYVQVPLICLPHGFDHVDTAARVTYYRVGLSLDPLTVTPAQVTSAIIAIERGDYAVQAGRLSRVFVHAGGVTEAARLVEFYQQIWPVDTGVMTSQESYSAGLALVAVLIGTLYLLTTRLC